MSYQICLEPNSRVFTVEEDERILTAGLAAHIKMPYGCRMGTCRSCRGKIVSGTVDLGDAHPTYLTQEQRDQGYALLCQATAKSDLVIEVEEISGMAEPQIFPVIVKTITKPIPDVSIINFRLPLHINLQFAAGQYIDLLLGDGVRRSYSIASSPQAAGVIDLELHIRSIPGGLFSDNRLSTLKLREKLEIEAPLGSFFIRPSEKPAIMIAGGTGYAPIRSMLLETLPLNTGRKFVLYWGARTLQDIYMHDEAQALADKYPEFTFVPVLSRSTPQDNWTGRTGYANHAALEDYPDLSGWQAYACGTPALVEAARVDFSTLGRMPEEEFFADSFVTQAELAMVTA